MTNEPESEKRDPAEELSKELRAALYFGERQNLHAGAVLSEMARLQAWMAVSIELQKGILVRMGGDREQINEEVEASYKAFLDGISEGIKTMIRQSAPADEIPKPPSEEEVAQKV